MPGRARFRLLLFADSRSASSIALTRTALEHAAGACAEVVAVVDLGGARPVWRMLPFTLAARAVRRLSEPGGRYVSLQRRPLVASCGRLARRHRTPLFLPPDGDVNEPRFVERVARELRPDGSLALLIGRLFSEPLLAACRAPTNYHNGRLPAYRGIGATGWSVYRGEARSGFAYHRMTAAVDAGPVLEQGEVAIAPGAGAAEVERAKTGLAAARLPGVLAALVAGEPGRAQQGEPSNYTRADLAAVRRVERPGAVTWDDLDRRLRAFELVELTLAGRSWPVTALRREPSSPVHPELAFTTADGVRCEPSRFMHLPLGLYRIYSRLVRRGGG